MGVDGRMQGQKSNASRILLVAFTIWALAMIIPDLYRLVQPLGSFGFYVNNDGFVTDVQGPFPDETASPAFQASLQLGDRLDLAQMQCIPVHTLKCASALAALGAYALSATTGAPSSCLPQPRKDRRGKWTSSPSNGRSAGGL
jgi:hypothetical protein